MSIDIPVLLPSESGRTIRATVLVVAEYLKAPIIPVSFPAFSRSGLKDVQLVQRVDLEAVFVGDGNRYFLSGYDQQEAPPLYFLCELPRPVETVEEAREALKPESVLRAEKAGIEVRRQGDLFAIKSDLTTAALRAEGAKIFPSEDVGEVVQLYGTAHTASRVAVLPGGVMLASGQMHHRPPLIGEKRAPDHRPCALDDGWWWVARNTVPIADRQVDQPALLPTPPTRSGWSEIRIRSFTGEAVWTIRTSP